MNILFVTQYFYPENFRINDLAIALTQQGHKVSVLTGMPNYPQGKYYKGYGNNGPFFEKWEDIDIYRVNNRPRKMGSVNLALNYISFIIKGIQGAKVLAEKQDFDVIYAFGTSPITQALPAISIRKRKHTPIILNVQDLWPDNVAVITGIDNKLFIKAIDLLVDYIYNRCDIILGTSRSFVEAIRSRKGLKVKAKVKYWPQYATVKRSGEASKEFYTQGAFNIAFTGNIGQGQGLLQVIQAMESCRDLGIVLNLFGDGRQKGALIKYVNDNNLEKIVRFHGSFPDEEIPKILSGADAALLSLDSSPIFDKTIPAKLQTYLTCGCAVIGVVSGEAKSLIESNQIGLCTEDRSAKSIADLFVKMADLDRDSLDEMRKKAIEVSAREFDKAGLIAELIKMMEVLSK